jgi:predicted permease
MMTNPYIPASVLALVLAVLNVPVPVVLAGFLVASVGVAVGLAWRDIRRERDWWRTM